VDYKKAGVDVEAGYKVVSLIKNLSAKTHNKRVLANIGSFGSLFDISNLGFDDPVLVSGTDGVGTKLKLAFKFDKHNTVGQDLVAMCVNDIICLGAKPLFFLDYIAVGKNNPKKIAIIVKGIAKACQESKVALIGGETAEMPQMYKNNEYDLAGFCVGVVSKKKIPNVKNVKAGNVLIGLKSSGVHSNGFSLVRKVYKNQVPKSLLTSTKLYTDSILKLFEKVNVKSVANITGGGFYENIPRALPKNVKAVINKNSWKVPKTFLDIQEKGKISQKNMFKTFNMGIGMVVIVNKNDVPKTLEILKKGNPVVIGNIENSKSGGVEII
jgi:phosphoribosylformylglycinamidine cyclo-ligase